MKVLLTGANGFVGSHILDRLCTRGFESAVLLRPASSRQFLEPNLAREVRLQKLPGGCRTQQDRGFEPTGAKAIENVASNKAIGAGQQYLHVAPTN